MLWDRGLLFWSPIDLFWVPEKPNDWLMCYILMTLIHTKSIKSILIPLQKAIDSPNSLGQNIAIWKSHAKFHDLLYVPAHYSMLAPCVCYKHLIHLIFNLIPAKNNHKEDTKPVPSAGILAILQTFCDGKNVDQYHLPVFPNSTWVD